LPEINIRGHAGLELAIGIPHCEFDGKRGGRASFGGLHIAWRELGPTSAQPHHIIELVDDVLKPANNLENRSS
jgi:hypothetical protein